MFFKKLFEQKKKYEKNVSVLTKEIKKLRKELKDIKEHQQSVVIEHVNIEKLMIDKYETNNHLGQLGIKELKGKLYIGATYGEGYSSLIKNEEERSIEEDKTRSKVQEKPKEGPKINIR
ncbi:hypothetical protein [Falsibacillus albus]|nr:hypothetical protein [Falsibacillus albus]